MLILGLKELKPVLLRAFTHLFPIDRPEKYVCRYICKSRLRMTAQTLNGILITKCKQT